MQLQTGILTPVVLNPSSTGGSAVYNLISEMLIINLFITYVALCILLMIETIRIGHWRKAWLAFIPLFNIYLMSTISGWPRSFISFVVVPLVFAVIARNLYIPVLFFTQFSLFILPVWVLIWIFTSLAMLGEMLVRTRPNIMMFVTFVALIDLGYIGIY